MSVDGEARQKKAFNTIRAVAIWSFVAPTAAAVVTSAAAMFIYWKNGDVPSGLQIAVTAAATYLFTKLPQNMADFQALAAKLIAEDNEQ